MIVGILKEYDLIGRYEPERNEAGEILGFLGDPK